MTLLLLWGTHGCVSGEGALDGVWWRLSRHVCRRRGKHGGGQGFVGEQSAHSRGICIWRVPTCLWWWFCRGPFIVLLDWWSVQGMRVVETVRSFACLPACQSVVFAFPYGVGCYVRHTGESCYVYIRSVIFFLCLSRLPMLVDMFLLGLDWLLSLFAVDFVVLLFS